MLCEGRVLGYRCGSPGSEVAGVGGVRGLALEAAAPPVDVPRPGAVGGTRDGGYGSAHVSRLRAARTDRTAALG